MTGWITRESAMATPTIDMGAGHVSTREFISQLVSDAVGERKRRVEVEATRLLRLWVSELEPCLIYRHDGAFAGIGPRYPQAIGQPAIITLRAWE